MNGIFRMLLGTCNSGGAAQQRPYGRMDGLLGMVVRKCNLGGAAQQRRYGESAWVGVVVGALLWSAPLALATPVPLNYRVLVRNAIVASDLPAAESYAREALKFARKKANTVEEVLEWQHQIAQIQDAQGKYPEAEANLRSELKERQAHYGPTHTLVEHSWNDLFQNLERQHRYAEAYDAALHQFEILSAIHGPDHFGMAQSYLDLGRLSFKAGLPTVAFDYYTKAICLLTPDAAANAGMLRQAHREIALVQAQIACLSVVPVK